MGVVEKRSWREPRRYHLSIGGITQYLRTSVLEPDASNPDHALERQEFPF
jgi:hypothetical protein